jgi:hypothetical protein
MEAGGCGRFPLGVTNGSDAVVEGENADFSNELKYTFSITEVEGKTSTYAILRAEAIFTVVCLFSLSAPTKATPTRSTFKILPRNIFLVEERCIKAKMEKFRECVYCHKSLIGKKKFFEDGCIWKVAGNTEYRRHGMTIGPLHSLLCRMFWPVFAGYRGSSPEILHGPLLTRLFLSQRACEVGRKASRLFEEQNCGLKLGILLD